MCDGWIIIIPFFNSIYCILFIFSLADSGGLGQPSNSLHGLNFSQSYINSEIGRSESQNQHQNLNGYATGQQLFHARQIEANFLGPDAVSDRHLTSRGLSIHEAQQVNNPELSKKNVARLETTDSPVNFDFFGGQQQLNSRNPSVTQILPKQQLGNPDMQLLQQQAMFSHIQEFQRQHQYQQQEARQHGLMSQISSKPGAGNHSAALIDGIPVNELSTSPWQPEHMGSNTNSLQHSLSTPMQGPSSGFVFPSEQQQALRMMGLIPEQVDQSLYGVPISTASSFPGSNSLIPTDKPAMQQLSVSNNPISGSHYTAYPDQVSMQDGMVVRQDFQGKSMFGMSASQGLNGGLNSENSQHVNLQHRHASMQEFSGRQEFDGRSQMSQEKTMAQIAPSQNVATLDPTEEKILYGSDDNLWDAFGRSDNITAGGYSMADGSDFNSGYSFLQSGSWSALMQSAVAETSSGDMGVQEGWGGVNFNNSGPPNGNQQHSEANDSGKLQPVWVDNNLQTLNSRHASVSAEANTKPNNYINSANVPSFQQPVQKSFFQQTEGFQNSSAQNSTPSSLEGERKWVDRNLQPKSHAEGRNLSENEGNTSGVEINTNNLSGSWLRQQSVATYNSQPSKPNGWSYIEPMISHEGNNMKNHENHNMSQSSQGGDHKRSMREEMGSSATFKQNQDSISNPNDELQHANHAVENTQVYNEGSNLMNNAAIANASSLRDDLGSRQQNPVNRNLSFWKDANSSMDLKESGFMAKYQHHIDKGSQILESGNSCLEKNATEMNEVENSNASDTHTSSGSKQKGGNTIRKPSVTSRRFQYHPMGNLEMDVEPSFGTSHVTQPQAHVQQNSHGLKGSEPSNLRQSKSGTEGNSIDVEKVMRLYFFSNDNSFNPFLLYISNFEYTFKVSVINGGLSLFSE